MFTKIDISWSGMRTESLCFQSYRKRRVEKSSRPIHLPREEANGGHATKTISGKTYSFDTIEGEIEHLSESVKIRLRKLVSKLQLLSLYSPRKNTIEYVERQHGILEVESLVETIISSCCEAPIKID